MSKLLTESKPAGKSGRSAQSPARGESKDQRPVKIAAGVPHGRLVPRRIVDTADVVMLGHRESVAAERFRRLKTMLVNKKREGDQVLQVTSAAPDEGKSFISLNLALAFATDSGETLLIDGDLRRPSLQNWLSPAPTIGLSELLTGQVDLEHVLFSTKNSPLTILPAGARAADPSALLASEAFRSLMGRLRQRFQWVVIDTPPVVLFSDADAVGAVSDGVVMVVRAGVTPKSMYQQALESLTSARVLGTVVNELTYNLPDRQRQYAGYYRWYYDGERRD